MHAYPTSSQTGHRQRLGRIYKSTFGPRELTRGGMDDLKAYARQVMSEPIERLKARADEARCYKQQCMTDPWVKGSMFSQAVKVTLVAWNRRKHEWKVEDN